MSVSIIIPTFNRLWSLPEAIASCPHDRSTEIIVVDDGSTDGTWEWLLAQEGIRAVRQDNWGKPAAANAGFALATGDYVRFLDSDDLLIADAAAAQLDDALAKGADVSAAGYVARYEESGREVLHAWVDCGDFLAQQLGECDSSHYSAYLFRRAFLDGIAHRPEFAFRDDRMFILECALRSPATVSFDQPTLIHRHHGRARIQFQPGSTAVVTNWQERQMWRKVHGLLTASNRVTARYAAALAKNLWPLALRVAGYNRGEALEIIAWMYTVDPDFRIPSQGVHRMYRALGFPIAQTLVNAARAVRNLGRRFAGPQ